MPDDALASMYAVEAPEIARRRAGAIDRLSDALGIQRGEELGAVLQALLEEEIWSATGAPPGPGEEFTTQDAPVPAPAVPAPAVAAPAVPVVPVASEPGLELLAEREGMEPPAPEEAAAPAPAPEPAPDPEPAVPAPEPSPEPPKERRIPHLALALFGTGIAALLAAVALVGATQFGDDGRAAADGGAGDGTRHFVPAAVGPGAAPFPSEPPTVSCYSTAYARGRTTLFRAPGGRRLLRVSARTEWESPRVFGVVRREGDWLAVLAPELPNGKAGWVRARDVRLDCTTWSLHADLSKRMVFVRREGKTVRRMRVAIGRPGNTTPKGRFAVTDKLRVKDAGSPYGCCVLALNGHQTNLPPDWPGGDRLAIHATKDEASIGQAASLGCLRAEARQAKWLIETIPLGAPVFIRS